MRGDWRFAEVSTETPVVATLQVGWAHVIVGTTLRALLSGYSVWAVRPYSGAESRLQLRRSPSTATVGPSVGGTAPVRAGGRLRKIG